MNEYRISREVYWNISPVGQVVFMCLAAVAVGFLAYGLSLHLRRILNGKKVQPPPAANRFWPVANALVTLITNRRIFIRFRTAGWMHLCIMWGMVVLFIGTVIVMVEYDLLHKILGLAHGFWHGRFYLWSKLALDIFGLLFCAGLLTAILRRYVFRAPQLKRQATDLLLPLWLLTIGVMGFLLEALRLSIQGPALAYNPHWSPVGAFLSPVFGHLEDGAKLTGFKALWWTHGLLALGFVAVFPYAPKLIHAFAAAVNSLLNYQEPRGQLTKLDVEAAFEKEEMLGFEKLPDFSRKDLLDIESCTECGRCESNCPAHLSGKTLSPRKLILNVKAQIEAEIPAFGKARTPQTIIGHAVQADEIWACTTCRACVESCPAYIDPLNKILELRRCEVMSKNRFPEAFAAVFDGVEKRANPWNQHPSLRMDWAKGLEVKTMATAQAEGVSVDFLFWVGCAAAFEPRNQKIARSLVSILKACQISFAVLGEEETCTGDFLRRMGHEFLFQIQAKANIATLSKYSFRKILTLCPHCYHTLKNDYTELGGHYDVVSHVEFIQTLAEQNKLKYTTAVPSLVSYHDSCYLGRYNRMFDAPRKILKQIPGVTTVEMERCRETSMCCGAGGGLMWIEEEPGKRTNEHRVKQLETALQTKRNEHGKIVATACPFCMTMMEDGLSSLKSKAQAKDIAEITAQAMGLSP